MTIKMKTYMISAIIGFCTILSVKAQSQSGPLRIDLQTAIQVAMDENSLIKIADLEIERQKYVRRETVGNHLPSLGVSGTYTRAIVKSDMGGGLSFDPDNTVAAQANLTVPLFVPGVYKTLKVNEEQLRGAVEAARGSRITLVNSVKKSYYNILLLEQSLEVLRTSERTISETVQDVKVKFDNGLASEYDYLTASVQLSNLQPSIIQTENAIEYGYKTLKMLMGLPLDINIDVVGSLDSNTYSTQTGYGDNGDVSYNSDLRAMEIQINILERQLQATKTQRMPTLAAFGNFSLSGRDPIDFGGLGGGTGGTGTTTPSSSKSFFWTHPISAGLQLSIPIFSGFTNTNREKQLRNNISQVRLQRNYLEENTKVSLDNARIAVITADATMAANKQTINQAQKAYDISRTRYDAGVGTMLEVNNAELSLTQAKLNYTQSIYDLLAAQADYEAVIGVDDYYPTTSVRQ